MAHFVSNPPDKVNLTAITELNLMHENGEATVCVWGMPHGKSASVRLRREVGGSFSCKFQKIEGNFTYLYLRGLIPGDEIAAFYVDAAHPDWCQYTDWLTVKKVSAYHNAKRPSAHKSTFILDSYGSEQRHPPVKESDWFAGVEESLRLIKNNSVGRFLINAISGVTIKPYLENDVNADSSVSFTAQVCKSALPGGRADEVLFHELVHVLEWQDGGGSNGYTDIKDGTNENDQFYWSNTDFLTVTATNVYSSMLRRKLRHDHGPHREMVSKYRDDVMAFRQLQLANITKAKAKLPGFVHDLAVSSPYAWSPFRDIPPLLPGPVPTQAGALLRVGSSGPEVYRLQSALNGQNLPAPKLDVDGKFGELTRRTVILFQARSKLDSDGVVGPLTRAALGI